MSKPYRIRVQDVVTASDFSTFHVDPLPLMPPGEFAELLEQVLEEAGWSQNEEGRMSLEVKGGMRFVFDPEKMQIVTEVEGEDSIDQTIEGWSREALEEQGKEMVERRERNLSERITKRLEETSDERRQECENLVVEATGRAIKQAAERLGDIQEIHEERGEGGRYSLTITVEERS